jgi:hypothetical protein
MKNLVIKALEILPLIFRCDGDDFTSCDVADTSDRK